MFDEVLKIKLQDEVQASGIALTDAVPTTDEYLVSAVLDGDDTAFAEIFDRYKLLVTRVVGRFFRDRSEIEEFVQQSFTKIYLSLAKFRGGEKDSFPAWISRITVNVCYDHFRRRGRRPESTFTDMSSGESDYVETIADGRQASVEQKLAAAQLAERVLAVLEEKDRIAMTLVYCGDYSLNEVADLMEISVSNLKSRMFRCRNQLREKFEHLIR
jgi:RNA polymerase sigma-70 factor (ECF subfamily)